MSPSFVSNYIGRSAHRPTSETTVSSGSSFRIGKGRAAIKPRRELSLVFNFVGNYKRGGYSCTMMERYRHRSHTSMSSMTDINYRHEQEIRGTGSEITENSGIRGSRDRYEKEGKEGRTKRKIFVRT